MSGLPTTTKSWQYASVAGGLESQLQLKDVAIRKIKPNEHLIRILATSLNPVDYKVAEAPIVGGILVRKPAVPCYDIAGEIVQAASGSKLQPGQLVFGGTGGSPFAGGGLTEYVVAPANQIIAVPKGISAVEAASIPIAGITAYQSIKPHSKEGDRILLNGGSGGVGLFGIQIGKALGRHVTVTCSTRNIELCKAAGADVVVDYTKGDLIDNLKALGQPFDLVIDNAGSNHDLYWKCDQFTTADAKYVNVASSPAWKDVSFMLKANAVPSFLGGQKRKLQGLFAQPIEADLQQIIDWMQEGKVKAHIDSTFSMQQAPDAFRQLKTGRSRGKVVIQVAEPKSEAN
ncbi:putative zinc-type alcohol dehydrogenase-like protein C16A3.02c [Dissoconium aciculare CBS 342.82]|uniref:Zinc-type alcohol dehydrogenase-like protein C16A3.02c n=1 Tax=Dissoconium aciculare CBS 342.82 TaxID=1314786 RepID=A0A6J3M2B5_9PEZI|nr:putative zinc-type alcohol dehydrogenase-like protein C16A3.02c [Dissoconium aciculare CBS 342.82]KAF1821639.1 putative zinc-type alcohol dehydrogenase-like protein C16A3.02c [Dissoconium aciculare CBS 342.82]